MKRRIGIALTLSRSIMLGAPGAAPSGAVPAPAGGYRLLGGDGGIFTFGADHFFGSAASTPANCPAEHHRPHAAQRHLLCDGNDAEQSGLLDLERRHAQGVPLR